MYGNGYVSFQYPRNLYIITCLNDLRPVALTSVAIKSCERFALKLLKPIVDKYLDPMQFAYRSKRSTEDAIFIQSRKTVFTS